MNILFRFLARQILRRLSDPANVDAAAKLLLGLGQHFIEPSLNRKYAAEWQRNCFHVTHMNFYSPIPNINELPDRLWESPSKMISIDMNDSAQLQLMQVEFPRFRDEYMAIPAAATAVAYEFHLNNPMFDNADALALYCMIRTFAPRRFIEIGSGYSTRLAAAAALRNGETEVICIDPYATDVIRAGFPGLTELIPEPAESTEVDIISKISPGDILFIDSSHVVKTGGDVPFLFLEILPRVPPGTIIHVHDIFLPWEYPKTWVKDLAIYYSEQYLLQAFLQFNSGFEVLLANCYLANKYPEVLKDTFPNSPQLGGASFWIRRRR